MPPTKRKSSPTEIPDPKRSKATPIDAFALISNKATSSSKKLDPMDSNSNFLLKSSEHWTVIAGSVLARREHTLPEDPTQSPKVAAFDLDGTILRPLGGRKFPKDEFDWEWLNSEIPHTLKRLSKEGYDIVIFTNQKNMHKIDSRYSGLDVPSRLSLITKKIDLVQKNLNIPLSAYVALASDVFRKPARGMFDLMLDAYHALQAGRPQTTEDFGNSDVFGEDDIFATSNTSSSSTSTTTTLPSPARSLIDMTASFYIGDAAGRAAVKGTAKDHSDADRAFAENIGLKFETPEKFFLKKAAPNDTNWEFKSIHPSSRVTLHSLHTLTKPYQLLSSLPAPEKTDSPYIFSEHVKAHIRKHYASLPSPHVIMLVGPPAAGKTTFSRTIFPDYAWVNQDTLKTLPAVVKTLSSFLDQGKNVVVDRTHGTKDARAKILEACVSRSPATPVHVLQIDVEKELTMLMNVVRVHAGKGKVDAVPAMVIHSYYKNFQPPEEKEGYASVHRVPWLPSIPEWNSEKYQHTVPAAPSPSSLHVSSQAAAIKDQTKSNNDLGAVSQSRSFADYFFQRVEGK